MTDKELEEAYKQLSEVFKGKQVSDVLDLLGNLIGDLAYDYDAPILRVLALINEAALNKYTFLTEDGDDETKH